MRNILNTISHVTHGFLAGFISIYLSHGLLIALFLFTQFLIYEYIEENKLKDEMFNELREWSFGFCTGIITALISCS
ncbi:MAG: hypothetical protein QXO15_00960 [Nitrososphaerota archaeon]